jgi:hypothetical protein
MKFNSLILAFIATACSSSSLFISALPVDAGLVARELGNPVLYWKRLNPQPLPPGRTIPQVDEPSKREPLPAI